MAARGAATSRAWAARTAEPALLPGGFLSPPLPEVLLPLPVLPPPLPVLPPLPELPPLPVLLPLPEVPALDAASYLSTTNLTTWSL